MTIKQQLLKSIYPVLMAAGKLFGIKSRVIENKNRIPPLASFYDLSTEATDGTKIEFKNFQGKNILLVNTASGCGYTNQLGDLDKLCKLYPELIVLAFPSNDFKEQEKLLDHEIAVFCRVNFGASYLITKKSVVTKGNSQNEVFSWLSHSRKNGWNEQPPEWNFSKYVVNKTGMLDSYFGPGVDPLSSKVRSRLESG